MIELNGKYNSAVCYASVLEEKAAAQILAVCNEPAFAECRIRIMPDVHAGMGCTIGTTMTVTDKVVPGMVGVDIGCGMETVMLEEREIDLARLDEVIRACVPCGREIRAAEHPLNDGIDLGELRCSPYVNLERARRSIGTLGGGNHFIEVDRDDDGGLYLVVHSGSRYLGKEVAEYYSAEGWRALCGCARFQLDELIARLRGEGRHKEIQTAVEKAKKQRSAGVPKELAYVEGKLFEDYIHDMKIVQRFAQLNRLAMTQVIIGETGLTERERFTTVHNYIDTDSMILRKGAVSAKKGEKLLIPMNMRDGSLICIGKGNDEWNCSAPHGAGRLMSRRAAFERLTIEEYREQMSGIYSTCVVPDTLDESPMAYKSMEDIVSNIGDTAEIIGVIKPIYNFKASE